MANPIRPAERPRLCDHRGSLPLLSCSSPPCRRPPPRSPSAWSGASPGTTRASSARPTRLPLQGRAGLSQADDQAATEPDPRARDQPPVHSPTPQFLGRARAGCSPSRTIRTLARPRTCSRSTASPSAWRFHPDYERQWLHLHRPERPFEGRKGDAGRCATRSTSQPPHRIDPAFEAS